MCVELARLPPVTEALVLVIWFYNVFLMWTINTVQLVHYIFVITLIINILSSVHSKWLIHFEYYSSVQLLSTFLNNYKFLWVITPKCSYWFNKMKLLKIKKQKYLEYNMSHHKTVTSNGTFYMIDKIAIKVTYNDTPIIIFI